MSRILVVAAEPSGDLHASMVVKEIKEKNKDIQIDAVGGENLIANADSVVVDMRGQAVMGLMEVLKKLTFFKNALNTTIQYIKQYPPSAVIVVDAPSFNLRLCKRIKNLYPGVPIYYYIAPKLWVWKEWRAKELRKYCKKVFAIFPFEENWFRERQIDCKYVGNPTWDQVKIVRRNITKVADTKDWEKSTIAVFPGSRKSEIKYIWGRCAKAIELLQNKMPALNFKLVLANELNKKELEKFAEIPSNVVCVQGNSQEIMSKCDIVMAKSGTTTLEAALLEKPMVVFYVANQISFSIAKRWVKVPYVSLPNILLQNKVVEELLQQNATGENIANEIIKIISNEKYRQEMKSNFFKLINLLDGKSAPQSVAEEIINDMRN